MTYKKYFFVYQNNFTQCFAGKTQIRKQKTTFNKQKNNENKAQYLRSLNWEELSELVTEVRRVIESIAPTVAKFRKEVSVVIGKRLGKGASELIWQTPMMFEVHQRFMKDYMFPILVN